MAGVGTPSGELKDRVEAVDLCCHCSGCYGQWLTPQQLNGHMAWFHSYQAQQGFSTAWKNVELTLVGKAMFHYCTKEMLLWIKQHSKAHSDVGIETDGRYGQYNNKTPGEVAARCW